MKLLTRSEELVLLAIWKLQDNAYGITIKEELERITGKEWSIGAVYAPLHRIEKKELVSSFQGDPIAERGGRSRVYYQLTRDGKDALLEAKRIHDAGWDDIPVLGMQ